MIFFEMLINKILIKFLSYYLCYITLMPPYFGETRLATPYFEEIILILNLPYYLIILLENLAPQFSLVWKLN